MSLHLAFLFQIGASCLAAATPIEQCGGPVQILQGDVLMQTRRSPTARVSELAQASDSTNATVEVAGPSGDETATNSESHELCDPPEEENVHVYQLSPGSFQPPRIVQVPNSTSILPPDMLATAPVPLANSSVHKIVGDKGVIMLSMNRFPDRSTYASSQLIRIGIYPILLPATDGSCASKAALEKGCGSQGTCSSGRTGNGCASADEQAVADSHRRALEVALKRQVEWTAIFEDDAIPVFGDNVDWNSEFEKAWATKPETATIVRLGWCLPPGMHPAEQITNQTGGFFQWVRTDVSAHAGCTQAYMVHKSIIPEMLKAFPCCCAVDCCYAWDVYSKTPALINLAAVGGEEWIKENEIVDWGEHDGVIMQAKSKHGLKSARTGGFLSIQRARPVIYGFSSKYSLQRDANTGSMTLVAK